LLSTFFVIEIGIGFWSHSLSLLADAGHMLWDIAALTLSLVAVWMAQKPATYRATFGHQRLEILAAFCNGLGLLAIALLIGWEAVERLQTPEPLVGLPLLIGAIAGLTVNSLNIALLHRHSHNDLNLQGALLHMISDAASAISVIVSAVAVYCWQWFWVDAAASLVVAALTCTSALPLIQTSLTILLEYVPSGIELTDVKAALLAFEGVEQIEELYLWSINSTQRMACARLGVSASLDAQERDRLLQQLQASLRQRFGIQETVLQLRVTPPTVDFPLHPLFNQSLISVVSQQTPHQES
jgi:cobalt-zinc-cadmium efflux system protein